MKNIFNKKKLIISSIISIILIIFIISLHNLFMVDDSFKYAYFILSIVFAILICPLYSINLKLSSKYKTSFNIITFVISDILICFVLELLNSNNMFTIGFTKLLFNFIIIGIIYLIIFAITNRARLTLIISNTFLFVLGFINYMVMMFRGTPLSLLDVLSIKTGISVAFAYKIHFTFYTVVATVFFIFLLFLILRTKSETDKKHKFFRIVSLLFCMLIIYIFFTTNFISLFNLYTYLWIPSNEYKTNGFLASFVKQTKEINVSKPENYSLEFFEDFKNANYLAKIIEQNPNINENLSEDKPNIIVIMNESFSDLTVRRSFETDKEYMPYFKSIMSSTISGTVHTSVYGGKTPNSEWEFLTNNSMAFLTYANIPYQQFINRYSHSLVSTLKSQGYYTSSIHPWYSTGYRRNYIYQFFEFDSSVFLEDMDGLEYIRKYPSDLSTYQYLISSFENRDRSKPYFNFTITMQNHSGYDLPGMESEIFLKDISDCPRTEQYLTLISKSDDALKYLIDYFDNIDDKTIILFFGDHQPPYLDDAFLNYLDAAKEPDSLSDEEKSYMTPYFIWANYDIPEYEVQDISLNYLSILLLDVAGLKTTTYMNFLRNMQKEIPVITGHGYMDENGNYYNFEEGLNENLKFIEDYRLLQFNNMFDKKNKFDELFIINN